MPKVNVEVPSVGESVSEATLGRIIAKEGTFVNEGDPVVELESEKASMEIPAPSSGVISYSSKEGDTLTIGQVFATIDSDAAKPSGDEKPKPEEPSKSEKPPEKTPEKAPEKAPEKENEEPKSEKISEEGARISMDDHLSALKESPKKAPPSEPKAAPISKDSTSKIKEEDEQTRTPMSRLRKTIAKRLVQVKNETAMLTTFNEVDMSAIMALRAREKDAFQKKHDVKLSFMPFFVKACASALKEFPEVNSFIDGEEIVSNKGVHIGIAVSTPTGLVVPVMRNVEKMSIVEIAKNMNDLALKARDRKLTVADMSGGTFTITNGGVFGSMLSTPILNPPQSAILGMHNIVERPVAIDGKVEIRPIMYLALSYDHRIIDGKESVSFLVHVKNMLEDPARILFYE